jgi:hypothetical protein
LLPQAAETQRLLPPGHKWRASHANSKYELCGSYPPLLVVPADVDDSVLQEVAKFRQNRRLPVMT